LQAERQIPELEQQNQLGSGELTFRGLPDPTKSGRHFIRQNTSSIHNARIAAQKFPGCTTKRRRCAR
jgi:hypothetical protein